MAESHLRTRIVHKHDIEVNWLKAVNFVPMQAEIIVYDIEVDASGNTLALPDGRTEPYTYERFKIGDGKTFVSDLPFYGEDLSSYLTAEEATAQDAVILAEAQAYTDQEVQLDRDRLITLEEKVVLATETDILELLSKANVVQPLTDDQGYTYQDADSKILTM